MSAVLKVVDIQKLDVQAQNDTVLDVTVALSDSETNELLDTRKLGFPLDTTKEALEAELAKFLETYNSDIENAVKNAELDAIHAQADSVIESLTGVEIADNGSITQAQPEPATEEANPQASQPLTTPEESNTL